MRPLTLRIYEIIPGLIYQSPALTEWAPIANRGINIIVDLEGGLDNIIPRVSPESLLYICYPIIDGDLPRIDTMWKIAEFCANLIRWENKKLLSHCAAGINRSSLMNGMILHKLFPEWSGRKIVETIKKGRPGALTNKNFERFLLLLNSEREKEL